MSRCADGRRQHGSGLPKYYAIKAVAGSSDVAHIRRQHGNPDISEVRIIMGAI